MSSAVEQAAGGLVWRDSDNGPEVLLAHRPRYNDWAYPKGKLDDGESLIECAAREVHEETGLRCRVGRYLGTTSYLLPSGKTKEISYWAMEVADGEFVPNDEVDQIKWVALADLAKHLDYQIDADFAAGLGADWRQPADRILLVRHAHAGDRYRWTGDNDRTRPLSDRGARESDAIASLLELFDIDRIVTSPAARCAETIEPLAATRSMTFEVEEDLWESASQEAIARVVKSAAVGSNVICTHGPVVATTIHLLTGASLGVPMEKGSTWVLDFSDGQLCAANYLTAPRV